MKNYFSFMLLFLLISSSTAQDTPENAILLLSGGKMDVNFFFYSQLLSDKGQSISYKSPEIWDVWNNPASLVSFRQSYIGLGVKPELGIDPQHYYDLNSTIETEMDNAIVDYRTGGTEIDYPDIGVRVGQKGGLYGFHLVYPIPVGSNRSVLAFEIGQPFYLTLGGVNNGMSTMIETRKEVGDQDKIIHMRINALVQADLQLRATAYQFGFAHQFHKNVVIGGRLSRVSIESFVKGIANINGIMETAGTEYAFNDPYDPHIDFDAGETNKLDQSVFIDQKGSNWHVNLGGLYRLSESFVIGGNVNYRSTATLRGQMNVTQYKIPVLNADALINDDPDAKLVEPTKLDLAKLTLTEPIDNPTSDQLELTFPSSFGLQFSYQNYLVESTFALTKYWGEFGYDFLHDQRYLDLTYGFNLDLSIGFFKLSLGGIKADMIHAEYGEVQNRSSLWIPNGAVELAFFIMKNYHISGKLFAAPTPGIGVKLGYFF